MKTSGRRVGAAVRILGGRWKGRAVDGPPSARPTSGRARQALFNLLGDRIPGARVLDLFAGTGAVGLEAVSRGAQSAVLVETDGGPLARTLERLGARAPEVRLVEESASAAIAELARRGERFDVVFADPPYGLDAAGAGLGRAADVLEAEGVLVLQQDRGAEVLEVTGLELRSRRAYGRNVFLFFGML